jgi:hypothetical protein
VPAALLQLDPAIPVTIFTRGEWRKATAHGWMDYGIEGDLYWICFVDDSGEPWIGGNKNVRAQVNITLGRHKISLPETKPTEP